MVERMNDGSRRAMTGSIHRIREFELEKVCLVEEFDIVQIVGEGWFGKILLVEHRATDTEMVLKALPKPYVSIKDFYREFHYGLHLSAHRNIVTTYDVAFETAGFYVFSQEYAPLGDLTSNMVDTGIGELHSKRVAKQLAAALEHMHQRELVHRDVKLDNILIYKADFSRVKLCDFGETRRINSGVRRRNEWLPYSPPEVLKLPVDSSYRAQVTHDIWQFGIVLFICLTGCLPWQKAAFDDPRYLSYFNWYSSANPLKKQPKLFKMVSSKAQKMFKKFIEPRIERRATNFSEISKYIDDRWMAKGYQDRIAGSDIDELCPSMYSFHSDVNEKNILLKHFLEHGIETTVDRQAKKERIRDWIQNSVIVEETEEDAINAGMNSSEDEQEDELSGHRHNSDKHTKAALRYATEKHINPRTCEVIEGANDKNDIKLSYDLQNIEPVASINMARKLVQQEESNISQSSSNKDSAYGSLDFKGTVTNTRSNSLENAKGSPSRSQSNTSIPKPNSPIPKHIQRLMEINTNRSNSPDIRNSEQPLYKSNSNRNIDQNFNPNFSFIRSNDNNKEINKQIPKTYSPKVIRRTDPNFNPNYNSPTRSTNNNMEINNQIPHTYSPIIIEGNDQRFNPAFNTTRSNDSNIEINNQIPKTISPRMITRNLDTYNNPIPNTDKLNQIVHKNSYKSLKDTAYDTMLGRKDSLKDDTVVEESPYTSMMNIVQGQIQFTPYSQAGVSSNDRMVNVTITSLGNQRVNK